MADIVAPTWTYGTYPSSDGTPVTFDDALMRELERNSNFVIEKKILTPPVEYDWIDNAGNYHHGGLSSVVPSERTDAHGHIERVEFRDGVVHLHYAKTSDKLRGDLKSGRRLTSSGVFVPKYWYNDENGRRVELGPTVVGTSVLGGKRPAMRNAKIVPLHELPAARFGESVHPIDAHRAIEELRKTGFVSQTVDEEGRYAFSEMRIPTGLFQENTTMTDAEIQAAIQAAVTAAVTPLQTANAALTQKLTESETKFNERIQQFSESAQRKSEVKAFCESAQSPNGKKNPRLTDTNMQRFEKILMHPAVVKDADLDKELRAFVEAIPGIFVERGVRESEGGGDDADAGDEPAAMLKLRPAMFSEMSKHDATLAAGWDAAVKHDPKKFGALKDKPLAVRMAALKQHVIERDAATN